MNPSDVTRTGLIIASLIMVIIGGPVLIGTSPQDDWPRTWAGLTLFAAGGSILLGMLAASMLYRSHRDSSASDYS